MTTQTMERNAVYRGQMDSLDPQTGMMRCTIAQLYGNTVIDARPMIPRSGAFNLGTPMKPGDSVFLFFEGGEDGLPVWIPFTDENSYVPLIGGVLTGPLSGTYVVELEQGLSGNQIVGKSVAILARDFSVPAPGTTATLWVDDSPSALNSPVFQSGDQVVLRTLTREDDGSLDIVDCVGVVTSYTDGTLHASGVLRLGIDADTYLNVDADTGLAAANAAGSFAVNDEGVQSWTFTRNLSPNAGSATTGLVIVNHKTLVIDYGTTGNGVYEVVALDGPMGTGAPYMRVKTFDIAPVDDQFTVRTQIGKLTSVTGVPDEYGALFGDWNNRLTEPFIRLSTFGSEFFNVESKWFAGSAARIWINPAEPSFAVGTALPITYLNGVGFWVGVDPYDGIVKMHIGNPGANHLRFDGTNLSLTGNINASGGSFSGSISAAGGVVRVGASVLGTDEDGITMDGTTFNAWFRRTNTHPTVALRNTTYFSAGDASHRIQMDTGTQTYTISWPNFKVATNGVVTIGAGSLSGVLQIGAIKLGASVRAGYNGLDLDGLANYWLTRTTDNTTWFAVGGDNSSLSFNSLDGLVHLTGIVNVISGALAGHFTAGGNQVQIGNNINDGAAYAGLTLSGDWINAWVRRSDNSKYFRAGSDTTYMIMDTLGTYALEWPAFHVGTDGSLHATLVKLGGLIEIESSGGYGRFHCTNGYLFQTDNLQFHLSSDGNGYASGAWVDASSIAIKKDIDHLDREESRALLRQLRPVRYTSVHGGERQLGFVAEWTQPILPEVVVTRPGETEPSGVAYGRLTPVLVASVQAVDDAVEGMKVRMESMERELTALRALLVTREGTEPSA